MDTRWEKNCKEFLQKASTMPRVEELQQKVSRELVISMKVYTTCNSHIGSYLLKSWSQPIRTSYKARITVLTTTGITTTQHARHNAA